MAEILSTATEIVPVEDLVPYDKNPRIGDIGAIAESLEVNQQYRPIVVQKSSGKILAGNHTWMAAKSLGWDEIAVVFVDVDDEGAKRIVLADNRTNDLAAYDATVLTEILDSLPDVGGTGYSQSDLDVLLDQVVQKEEPEKIEEIIHPNVVKTQTKEEAEVDELEDAASSGGSVGGVNRPNFAEDEDIREADEESDDDEDLANLRLGFEVLEGEIWPSKSRFGIPQLRQDMLLEDLPDPIDTWVGGMHHPEEEIEDEERWWFYNYGVGIKKVPFERAIMGFYVFDEKFENWWHLPSYYVSRFYHLGVRIATVPDFSMWENWPQALCIYNLYRNFWLGRYFQECGWRVIPPIPYPSSRFWDYIYDGIPKGVPIASMQLQTFYDEKKEPEGFKEVFEGAVKGLERVRPEVVLAYGSDRGRDFLTRVLKVSKVKPEIVWVDSFAKKKQDLGVFKRERPKGNKRGMAGVKTDGVDEMDELDE